VNGPTPAAVIVAAVAGYGAFIVLLGRWVGRAAREQTTPVELTEAESERLWRELLVADPPVAPHVPQQGTRRYHPVGPPLDLDALIAQMEPCGTGVVPTCRLHDPAGLCLPGTDTRCCPTCTTNPART
jgi:hypothetical protein